MAVLARVAVAVFLREARNDSPPVRLQLQALAYRDAPAGEESQQHPPALKTLINKRG